jgi:MFS family permease
MDDGTPGRSAGANITLYIVLGLIQGVSWWLGTRFWPHENQWGQGLVLAGLIGISVFSLIVELSVSERRKYGSLMAAAGMSGLFALLALWYVFQLPDAGQPNSWKGVLTASSILAGMLLLYIALPFIQAWPERKNNRYRYQDLYRHSWDNFFVLLVAGMLTGAYWLLIVLWVMLFKMVGITLFEQCFFTPFFAWLTLPVVFSLGIHIGLIHDRIITTLRQIVHSLCGWLMPLAAVITLLFGVSLPFTGLQPVWDTGYSTPILLCLLGTNILLLNGIFQDGSKNMPYPRPLLRLVEGAILLMPVFSLIGVYSTFLRIEQYGLTPKRIYLALLLLVACCYSFAYAVAVIRRTKIWMQTMQPANTAIALFICLCIVLIHSPLVNPVALSAANQLSRLFSGRVKPADFDFGALKFQFGIPGQQALARLDNLPATNPVHKKIAGRLAVVNNATSYYEWNKAREKMKKRHPAQFTVIGGADLSLDGLENELEQKQCRHNPCHVYPIDLNNDNEEELIVIDPDYFYVQMLVFARDRRGIWHRKGVLGAQLCPKEQKKLLQQLHNRTAEPVPPLYQSLQVGESVYHFAADKLTENRSPNM